VALIFSKTAGTAAIILSITPRDFAAPSAPPVETDPSIMKQNNRSAFNQHNDKEFRKMYCKSILFRTYVNQ
jgi:hypothetical protein